MSSFARPHHRDEPRDTTGKSGDSFWPYVTSRGGNDGDSKEQNFGKIRNGGGEKTVGRGPFGAVPPLEREMSKMSSLVVLPREDDYRFSSELTAVSLRHARLVGGDQSRSVTSVDIDRRFANSASAQSIDV